MCKTNLSIETVIILFSQIFYIFIIHSDIRYFIQVFLEHSEHLLLCQKEYLFLLKFNVMYEKYEEESGHK
jgi:hypothetical protein